MKLKLITIFNIIVFLIVSVFLFVSFNPFIETKGISPVIKFIIFLCYIVALTLAILSLYYLRRDRKKYFIYQTNIKHISNKFFLIAFIFLFAGILIQTIGYNSETVDTLCTTRIGVRCYYDAPYFGIQFLKYLLISLGIAIVLRIPDIIFDLHTKFTKK